MTSRQRIVPASTKRGKANYYLSLQSQNRQFSLYRVFAYLQIQQRISCDYLQLRGEAFYQSIRRALGTFSKQQVAKMIKV